MFLKLHKSRHWHPSTQPLTKLYWAGHKSLFFLVFLNERTFFKQISPQRQFTSQLLKALRIHWAADMAILERETDSEFSTHSWTLTLLISTYQQVYTGWCYFWSSENRIIKLFLRAFLQTPSLCWSTNILFYNPWAFSCFTFVRLFTTCAE